MKLQCKLLEIKSNFNIFSTSDSDELLQMSWDVQDVPEYSSQCCLLQTLGIILVIKVIYQGTLNANSKKTENKRFCSDSFILSFQKSLIISGSNL